MWNANRKRWRLQLASMLAMCALVSLPGCTITLISTYDEVTDQGVAALQKEVDLFLIKLARNPAPPSCTHSANESFYSEALADVSGLIVRNDGRPENDITNKQLRLLQDSLETLEELHKLKTGNQCLSAAEIAPVRGNMNSSFTAITKLELAKKRGEEGGQ